jgi:hypothetical protein
LSLSLLVGALIGCAGLNVNAIPTQDLYADDGSVLTNDGAVTFAVVGDLRPAVPTDASKGRVATPKTQEIVARDISDAIQRGDLAFLVLLGDLVPASTTGDWKRFSKDWSLVLNGSELPETGTFRKASLPVAGDLDRVGDERLVGFGAAFPQVGTDIGYNRVASWYYVDVTTKKETWRLVVLDSDKAALGSRWDEQMAWIPKIAKGDFDSMLVFMHHPVYTLAKGGEPDLGGGPSELLAQLEDGAKIGTLKAVFGAHSNTNEIYMPSGKFGELHVVAGGGGAPADTLARWGANDDKDVKLETIFDVAMVREFDKWASANNIADGYKDHAHASGSFEGFTGEFDAKVFPIQGWWGVTLDGKDAELTFHMIGPDDKTKTVYTIQYNEKAGWKAGK